MQNDLDMNSKDILNAKALNVQTLSINGTQVSAGELPATEIPAQAGNSGKYLTTNGTATSWAQPDAPEVTFTQSGVGASATTVEAKLQEYVSVKDFGATGDGATDDTTAIQAAIDAVELAGGGTVFFPQGVYIVTDTITVDDVGVLLQGDGCPVVEQMFTTAVNPVGSVIKLDDAAFTSASKAIVQFIYQGAGSEARLGGGMRDMVVFGNRSTDTASPVNTGTYNNNNTYGIGVEMVGVRYITLFNVFALWCAEDGFKAVTGGSQSASCSNLYLERCVGVSNGDDGIAVGGDTHVSNCQVGYNGGDGIEASGGSYVNNLCWDNFGRGVRISSGDTTLTGGWYYDNQRDGILVSGARERISISGVICQDNGQDTGAPAAERSGVYVSGASTGVISGVFGNKNDNAPPQTLNAQQYGIRLAATSNFALGPVSDGGTANAVALISDLSVGSELTIATGAITVSRADSVLYHKVETEGAVSTDDLETISGGYAGQILVLQAANSARTVVAKDGTGNLQLGGDRSLDNTEDKLMLINLNGNTWHELSFSDNGA